MVLTYTGTKGEPVATPSGAAPTFAADLTEIADWFQTGRAFRKLATQAALIAATGMDDNDIAQVDNIDGATFKYDGALPGWRMYGIAVFDTAAARTSAITTPADNMLTIRRDADYVEQYLSGSWQRLVALPGLIPIIPTAANATGGGTATIGANGAVTLTGATTTFTVDGITGYKKYRVTLKTTSTSAGTLTMQLRTTAPATDTTSNYTTGAGAAAASWTLGASAQKHAISMDVFDLNQAVGKEITIQQYDHNPSANTAAITNTGLGFGGATPPAMAGFTITTSQPITGDMCFYGYNDN